MLKTILPQSPVLQQYIEFFYVFETDKPDQFSYFAFPHYNTGLSFFRDAQVNRKDFQVHVEKTEDTGIHIEILGKYTRPVLVHYNGPIQEVSVIFKPFGINRFIRENYHTIAPGFSQAFQNEKWALFGKELFEGLAEGAFDQLEAFLLRELVETEELAAIQRSLPVMEDIDSGFSILEVAEKTGYNLKSFQRHFTRHMGCSPVDYRRIVRFRNSVSSKLNASELKTLTDITYENNYFDQSYFIKEFKRLTHLNPKKFFKEVSLLDGDKIVWEIL